ncbi:hypothetical protein [Prevotella pallens]|uniref:hypothetical protein n=1 Tax=Prevotella pallens TaxID=60133 RepID=UPI001CB3DEF7|nr:hypothetical protein [Prevotella pallens]MBF1465672.1 hypothetical protein [Prevotella pallens]MBF1481362.1 hypothetical protein [Prevotella pallens]
MEIYESYGTVIWQADNDIYGNLHNCKAIRVFLSPFRQLDSVKTMRLDSTITVSEIII